MGINNVKIQHSSQRLIHRTAVLAAISLSETPSTAFANPALLKSQSKAPSSTRLLK